MVEKIDDETEDTLREDIVDSIQNMTSEELREFADRYIGAGDVDDLLTTELIESAESKYDGWEKESLKEIAEDAMRHCSKCRKEL